MKTEKKKKWYLFFIVVLSMVALIFLITTIFYHSKLVDRVYNTNLGDSLLMEIEDTGVFVANISYPNNLISGLEYNQKINIYGKEGVGKSYVRAKAIFADYNNIAIPADVLIEEKGDWFFNENDGYYYLEKYLNAEASFEFIKKITIPKLAPRVKNNAVLTIIVESADKSKNVLEFWEAPAEWFENIT